MKETFCIRIIILVEFLNVLASARPLNAYNASLELSARSKRQLADLVVKKFDFYPNGDNYEIPYEYTDDLNVAEFTSKLDEAREDFEQNTCMRLVPRTSQERYISYYKGTYCSSPIGAGTNVVEVSLGEGCWTKGTIIHETMHALGFFHEHSRPDRDNYVQIVEANIDPADLFQFGKYSTDPARIPVESYDFWSIMHYGSYYLSSNGAATMTDLDGNVFRTQNDGFSKTDVARINRMYECSPIITGSGGSEPPKEEVCEDTSGALSCNYWVSLNYCVERPGYMQERCCASCKSVTLPALTTTTENPRCVDASTICGIYAAAGKCKDVEFALDQCCKTCRLGHLITTEAEE